MRCLVKSYVILTWDRSIIVITSHKYGTKQKSNAPAHTHTHTDCQAHDDDDERDIKWCIEVIIKKKSNRPYDSINTHQIIHSFRRNINGLLQSSIK